MATILEKMLDNCKKAGYYPTQNIEKIANGLNITISELFEGIGGNCND